MNRFFALLWAEATRIRQARKRLTAETLVFALSVEGKAQDRYAMSEVSPFRKLTTPARTRLAQSFLDQYGPALRCQSR